MVNEPNDFQVLIGAAREICMDGEKRASERLYQSAEDFLVDSFDTYGRDLGGDTSQGHDTTGVGEDEEGAYEPPEES